MRKKNSFIYAQIGLKITPSRCRGMISIFDSAKKSEKSIFIPVLPQKRIFRIKKMTNTPPHGASIPKSFIYAPITLKSVSSRYFLILSIFDSAKKSVRWIFIPVLPQKRFNGTKKWKNTIFWPKFQHEHFRILEIWFHHWKGGEKFFRYSYSIYCIMI